MFLIAVLAIPAVVQAQRPGGVRRGDLEARFRQRFEEVLKQRLQLTDEQLRRLQDVNRRFEDERFNLLQEEMRVRRDMRRTLLEDSTQNNDEVAALVDRVLRTQRRRVELMENEQRELAQFLSPVQRARYLGFQEQLRRQMEEMREQREKDGAPPMGGPPPRIRGRRPPGEL
jgi:Spy/CpxP family protein refolding chaperone